MVAFNMDCPHCERAVTIVDDKISYQKHVCKLPNSDGRRTLISSFIVCPNPDCKRLTLRATLHRSEYDPDNNGEKLLDVLSHWKIAPEARGKSFPDYIPFPVRSDYEEACRIAALSPKASATLSRRCLQGMIRDFWKVKSGRLVDEVEAIRQKIDPLTWDAIDAVRKIGNIGAHMEKDVNVIVEVDPGEAELLIDLIENLFNDWYIQTEERKIRMNALVSAAAQKKAGQPPA